EVIALEPEQRVVDEKAGNLAAAEIVDGGVPVGMKAAARIVVLVKRGAVEPGQAVLVGREMRRHPIEDDSESCHMCAVDEAGELRGIAEARCRRKEARGL